MQERSPRPQSNPRNKPYFKRKTCRFCEDKALPIDYKAPHVLKDFITERGKILPRRITGTCSFHQKKLAAEIKRARIMALLPFTVHD
ncbi:MAG TPA: 30S ribosomal protein S18 [Deltaproteobacteria bacterium]|nr:30S ribosomal protein S18 [Deltaproteobacteria bacterium]HQI81995.1 30S ribosomal protein S18 [Deltaproteobacteria bacterium]